jgi:hypothetical protein
MALGKKSKISLQSVFVGVIAMNVIIIIILMMTIIGCSRPAVQSTAIQGRVGQVNVSSGQESLPAAQQAPVKVNDSKPVVMVSFDN